MSDSYEENSYANGQSVIVLAWRVPSTLPVYRLRCAIKMAGLDESLVADLPPRNALTRALREMSRGRVIRKLARVDEKTLKFQVTSENIDSFQATYTREAEVTMDLDTGIITSDSAQIGAYATKLVNEHLDKRLTSDLTKLVQKILDTRKADLIPIRDQGGAYFVPDQHRDLVEKIRVLLKEIGGCLRTFDVRLGSPGTAESVADSLEEAYLGWLEDLEHSCDSINIESRSDAISNRVGRIQELRDKLICYKVLLNGDASASATRAERIAQRIDAADQLLLKKMHEPAPVMPEEQGYVAEAVGV